MCKIAQSLRDCTTRCSGGMKLRNRVRVDWVDCRVCTAVCAVAYPSQPALPVLSDARKRVITVSFNETTHRLHYNSPAATWPPRPLETEKEAHMNRISLTASGLFVLTGMRAA